MAIRFFFLALLLLASPFLQVAKCQSDDAVDSGDVQILTENDETPRFGDDNFSPSAGIETVCVFPKNKAKLVRAGEETELLVGIKNNGEGSVNLVAIKASVHMPYDHKLLVQNLTAQEFNNATVPSSAQASFRYIFAVNKFLPPALFDLVGTIVYEIDQQPYKSTFHNGTIEVVGVVSFERLFLLIFAFVVFFSLGMWIGARQIKSQSKNSKKASKGLSKKNKKKKACKVA